MVARSAAMVVRGPCPGSTTTGSGNGSTLVRRLSTMASRSPPGRSVRPIEPANRTSPEKTSGSSSGPVANIVEPGVCPGAWAATKSIPATETVDPSCSSRTSSGSTKPEWPGASWASSARVSAPIDRNGSASRPRSSGCTQHGASLARQSGATANMWSRCPWVTITATGFSRCSATRSATPTSASIPGSMTTHSDPRSVATT